MSRHRNVRTMNYEDEYDGYDDVYGHSVEDDSYGLSPGTAQMYLYDREKDRSISNYMTQEEDIPEEPNNTETTLQETPEFSRPILSDIDNARLNSCLEEMTNILGESVSEHIMIDAVIRNNFEHDRALNDVLSQQEAPKPQRQPRTRRSRDLESESDSGVDLGGISTSDQLTTDSSGSGVLGDRVQGTEKVRSAAASGLSLSELAKLQTSEVHQSTKLTLGTPPGQTRHLKALSDLASMQNLGQSSLADLAMKQSDSVNIGTSKSVLSGPTMAYSPRREGVRLSELAKSTTAPKEPLKEVKSLLGNISVTKSGQSNSGSPKRQQFPLLSLAEMNKQATGSLVSPVKPFTIPLSDMAKQYTSPKSHTSLLAAKENSVPKVKPNSSQPGVGGLSLAALAQEHAFTSSLSQGKVSNTPQPSDGKFIVGGKITEHSVAQVSKMTVNPPPGFKHLGMQQTKLSNDSPSVKPTQPASAVPPPGFKPKVSVDLSQLAALHQTKRSTIRSRAHRDSSGEPAVLKALTCQQVASKQGSVFGQAMCMTNERRCSNEANHSVRYSAFSYQRQISGFPHIDNQPIIELMSFDFSTPSPDDIVKERQKAAFTRDGKFGSRGSSSSDPDKSAQPVISATEVTAAPAATEETPTVEGSVARMTFSSSKTISSGFTPEKNPIGNPLVDEIAVKNAKRALLSDTEETSKDKKNRIKKDEVLEVLPENCGMLTPKKEEGASSRSSSPLPTPKVPGKKHDNEEAKNEYDKRKQDGKDYINLVVIGHVDAGKSTLMGHVLYQLGFVNKRTMHKYETESKKLGKASFAYAWVLDETEEERARGVTMDVAQTRFEITSKIVTLLDAPGHKDFIPNMITGAAQADVAILVINAARGEFETGFDAGGQTREHAMLVRSLGVSQLVVAVNKLDMVDWSETRYKEIQTKIGHFLKQAGFKDSDVTFVPCSGLVGENLTKPPTDPKLSWFKGTSLIDSIDKFKPPLRQVDKPLRLCVADVFKGMGSGVSISGTLQAGAVSPGEKVLVMPQGVTANVRSITIDEAPVKYAFAGDNVVLVLTGIDIINIGIGSILCDPSDPVRTSNRIQARVVIFNIDVPITKGFPVVFHYQSLSEPASIKRLVSQLHKSTGEVIRSKPRCLVKHSSAVIELEIYRPVCIELYKDYKDLGRFMLRYGGSTIAAGLVTEIKDIKPPKTE